MGLFNWFKMENDGMVKISKKEQKRIARREHEARCYRGTHTVEHYMKLDINEKTWCLPYFGLCPFPGTPRDENELLNVRVYKFSDIISYDLMIDDESVVSGGLGRAMVGGILLGPAGAVVGGVTGDRKIKKNITGVSLKITVNNFDRPIEVLVFDKFDMRVAISSAEQCVTYLELMVRENENRGGQ